MEGDLRLGRFRTHFAAAAVLVFSAGAAWAQDYTVTAVSNKWVTPPASKVDLAITGDDSQYAMSSNTAWNANSFPPFPLSYYGKTFTTLSIACNGFVQMGTTSIGGGCCSPV